MEIIHTLSKKRGRPTKYTTTEEKLVAKRISQKKYALKNLEKQREMSKVSMRKLRLKKISKKIK